MYVTCDSDGSGVEDAGFVGPCPSLHAAARQVDNLPMLLAPLDNNGSRRTRQVSQALPVETRMAVRLALSGYGRTHHPRLASGHADTGLLREQGLGPC